MERIRLTEAELSAVLSVAGDAFAWETLSCGESEDDANKAMAAFETGMDKMKAMLGRKRRKREERRGGG